MIISYKAEAGKLSFTYHEEHFLKVADGERFWHFIHAISKRLDKKPLYRMYPETKKEGLWMAFAYCQFVESNKPLPKWLEAHFLESFKNLNAGMPVSKALGLVNSPYRPKSIAIEKRDTAIFRDVTEMMKLGSSLFDASLELSSKYNLHESTIQNIYSDCKHKYSEVIRLFGKIDF